MMDAFLYYLKVIVMFLIYSGILFLIFRVVTIFIINLLSKIFPRKYVKGFVSLVILFLISIIPYYIIRDYIYVFRNCVLIGSVETNEDSWIFSWKNNLIFMEKNKLGSFNSLEQAYKESEKNKLLSEIILNKENIYDVYLVYQIGLLKDSLSKEFTIDNKISIDKKKLNELGYSNYFISYYQGREYERTEEIVHKIVNTNDVNVIKKYYLNYTNGDYYATREDYILCQIAYNKITPKEVLIDLEERERGLSSIALCLIDNKNVPYEILFNYIEIENNLRRLVHNRAIQKYTEKLYRERRLEEWEEVKKLGNHQDYKIFRRTHEKYNKMYENIK